MPAIRDRVKELRRVPANELVPHPANWRKHPESQIQAFLGALQEVGFSTAAICRELPDGRIQVLDGHLRRETMGTAPIPCLILDLNEQEALKFLATADPLSSLAETDASQLAALAEQLQLEDAGLRSLIDDMLRAEGEQQGDGGVGQVAINERVEKMALLPNEHYDYVLVLARTTHEWQELCFRLGIEKVQFPGKKYSVGVGRAITADKVLKLLPAIEPPNGYDTPQDFNPDSSGERGLTESTSAPEDDIFGFDESE